MAFITKDGDRPIGKTLEGYEHLDIYPLWGYVVLLPLAQPNKVGKLELPDGSNLSDTLKALAVKCGPGDLRDNGTFIPNPIEPGDYVYHLAFSKPHKVMIKGKVFLIISSRDCVAWGKEA